MSLDTGRRLHAHICNEINLVQKSATAEHAIDLDEDGVPIMEWEVGAPIIYEDDNEIDDGDINDSDGNGICEIDDYEDYNENDDDDIADSKDNEGHIYSQI